MARKKKKSRRTTKSRSGKSSKQALRVSRLIWFAAFALLIACGLYWADRYFHFIPLRPGIEEPDLQSIVQETERALASEPSINNFEMKTSSQPGQPESSNNYLRIELGTDTEIILAEKIIQDVWTRRGMNVAVTYPENEREGAVYIAGRTGGLKTQVIAAGIFQKDEPDPGPTGSSALPAPSLSHAPRLAIIIDDLGYNLELAQRIVDIPFDLTLSILPYQIYSQDVLAMARRNGKEVMLHMPMEPLDYPSTDPGEGALLLKMNAGQIKDALSQALDSLPGVAGMNNHMGSAFTADEESMRVVMDVLGLRGIYFIDSRTIKDTEGYILANRMGLPAAERSVFLDNVREDMAIRHKVIELCNKADENGQAVGIGHPYPETIQVLEQALQSLAAAGYEIVPASEVVR
jgi:polysaccharide deacetylase 2 family uncharacterized protein YibQ